MIYIIDLLEGISITGKLFADDASIFSVVTDITVSAEQMNKDFKNILMWAYQWKLSFSLAISKQAQEITFSKEKFKCFLSPSLI